MMKDLKDEREIFQIIPGNSMGNEPYEYRNRMNRDSERSLLECMKERNRV